MPESLKLVLLVIAAAALSSCGSETSEPGSSRGDSSEAAKPVAAAPTSKPPIAQETSERGRFDAIPLRGSTAPSANFDRCMNSGQAAEGVTAAMMDCANDELELQDARLNATYKVVIASLDDATKRRLRESQRAWIEKRDACDTASDEENDGSLEFLTSSQCKLNQTIERSSWLEKYS